MNQLPRFEVVDLPYHLHHIIIYYNHIHTTMAQYPIFLNKHTTEFVIGAMLPGESIAVTAARLLRNLAANGTPIVDADATPDVVAKVLSGDVTTSK